MERHITSSTIGAIKFRLYELPSDLGPENNRDAVGVGIR